MSKERGTFDSSHNKQNPFSFKTGSHYTALNVLELTMLTRQTSNSQEFQKA